MLTPSARELWLFFVRFSTRSPAPPTAARGGAWRAARTVFRRQFARIRITCMNVLTNAFPASSSTCNLRRVASGFRRLAAWVSGMHESPVLNPESW